MTTALFYLMLSPLPDRYSFDHWVAKTKPKNPQALGFWRRVLQVHLCFVYFIGGAGKMSWQRLVGRLQSLALADPAAF